MRSVHVGMLLITLEQLAEYVGALRACGDAPLARAGNSITHECAPCMWGCSDTVTFCDAENGVRSAHVGIALYMLLPLWGTLVLVLVLVLFSGH